MNTFQQPTTHSQHTTDGFPVKKDPFSLGEDDHLLIAAWNKQRTTGGSDAALPGVHITVVAQDEQASEIPVHIVPGSNQERSEAPLTPISWRAGSGSHR